MEHKIVALLPIKAHSERVKGKNFRDFNGKPLFRYVLDALLDVDEIERVIINTDAREILKSKGLIESERILIRDRSTDICGDTVSMNKIIADDLNHVSANIYLMTHATNPLLSSGTIRQALDLFRKGLQADSVDSLFTVNKTQTRFYDSNGIPVNHDPQKLIPTQELEPWYEENSNLYIFTRDSFNMTRSRIGAKPLLYLQSKIESIDIDNPEDWDLALIADRFLKGR